MNIIHIPKVAGMADSIIFMSACPSGIVHSTRKKEATVFPQYFFCSISIRILFHGTKLI